MTSERLSFYPDKGVSPLPLGPDGLANLLPTNGVDGLLSLLSWGMTGFQPEGQRQKGRVPGVHRPFLDRGAVSLTSRPHFVAPHGQSASAGRPDLSISVSPGATLVGPLHEEGTKHRRLTSSFTNKKPKRARQDAFLPSTPSRAGFLGKRDRLIRGFARTLHACTQTARGEITFGAASLGPLKQLCKSGFSHLNANIPKTPANPIPPMCPGASCSG